MEPHAIHDKCFTVAFLLPVRTVSEHGQAMPRPHTAEQTMAFDMVTNLISVAID